jgi:hypothetical protein
MPLYKVKIEVEVIIADTSIENAYHCARLYRSEWWDWRLVSRAATEVKALDQVPEIWLDQVPLNGDDDGRTCRQWLGKVV